MKRSILPLAAVLAIVVAIAIQAQQQRFDTRVEVSVVEVPVTVIDRAGNSIRGLTKENFELFVEGAATPIDYFEVVDLTKITAADSKPLPTAAYRNFLLLFDLANSSPGTIGRAQAAAREFVEKQVEGRDLVAVAVFTDANGLRLLTSFTSDRPLIISAIDTLGEPDYFRVGDPLMLTSLRRSPETATAPRSELEQRFATFMEQWNQASRIAHENERRSRLRAQFENFGEMALALDRLRGQKQVILLSEGFDARLVTGREQLGFAATQPENDAVASGEIWKVDSQQRFGSSSEARGIHDMAELFRRSDVRLHAIDIKGLRTEVDAREGHKKVSNEALFLVTKPTGGSVFQNANDLAKNFAELLKQQEVIYVLGFTAPRAERIRKFHPLKVRLSGVKAAQISHRTGYYDASPETSKLEQTISLASIVMTEADVKEIPLSVVATPVPGSAETARMPVVIDMAGAQLVEGLRDTAATASLFVYAFDDKQRLRDFFHQRISLDLAKTGPAVRASGVRYLGALRLPPGHYTVRTLVRVEETGRTGFVRLPVTVPSFGENAVLPPVALGATADWVTVVSPSRGRDAAEILSIGEQAFVPDRSPELDSGTEQRIALMLYRMPLEDLAVTPRLLTPDGSSRDADVTLVGRTSPDESGVMKVVLNLKTEGLQKGDYGLQLRVASRGVSERVVELPFTIR